MDNQQTPIPPLPPIPTPQPTPPAQKADDNSNMYIVILLLFYFPLVGIVLMWMWMKSWPKWLKLAISLPFILLPLLAVLLAITLMAINPADRFAEAKDTQRRSYMTDYQNALSAYKNEIGNLPEEIQASDMEIAKNGADICDELIPNYMRVLGTDPSLVTGDISNCDSQYDTGFFIRRNADGTVTISAPSTESETPIEITR